MRKSLLIIAVLLLCKPIFAGDFAHVFIQKYGEEKRPLNNVNIGKTMLEKMAADTEDEELKNLFRELTGIHIVSTENKRDARHYFQKANELAKTDFEDFEEVVSVNEHKTKIHVLMKKHDNDLRDIILIALDDNRKLTIITVSGKVDLNSITKLSGSLKSEKTFSDEQKGETENKREESR